MNETMYKVELTEEEALALGTRRWKMPNKRRYIIRSLIALGVAVLFMVLALSLTAALSFAFALLSFAATFCSILFVFRLDAQAAKAGKAFVQALKGEEEKGK